MEFLIRPLDSSEYDRLIGLWQLSGLPFRPKGRDSFESMKRDFERMDTCILGSFDGDRLIGSIMGSSDGRKGWINRLAVDPDYRGQGQGLKLIKECEEFLSNFGIKVFACLIEDWNAPSLSVFKKAGYDITDEILYCSKRSSQDD